MHTIIYMENQNRQHERPIHKWEDTIRMDLRETEWESVDWLHLAQDRN
jgi:hypothetical protein